ncbi:MAG: hypothetical protein Q8S33_06025 [Myxococcales bacterium]|nr:hypothetical protein [Myxococcales bacterium]
MTHVPDAFASDAEWLVFADALQQQGDPRGELIALSHAGDVARRDAHVRKHAQALLGDAGALVESGFLKVTWRWSFIDAAEVRGSSAPAVATALDALLAAPTATRLRALSLIGVPAAGDPLLDLSAVVDRLSGEDVPASLTELSLIDHWAAQSTSLTSRDHESGPNLVTFGPLGTLWALKGLRALTLVVADTRQLDPGTIVAPELTSLTLHGLRFAEDNAAAGASEFAAALATATLPKLTTFDCRLCETWVVNELHFAGTYTAHDVAGEGAFEEGHHEGADWSGEFGDALRNLVTLPLRRLALTSFASTSSLLELLASTGLPPTLEELDLSDSALATSDLAWFTANKPVLSRLHRLVVKNTGFTEDDAKVLASLGPKVEHTMAATARMRVGGTVYISDDGSFGGLTPDDEEPEGDETPLTSAPLPKYRYVVGME